MELLIGTNNKGKIIEISEVLGDLATILTPEDFSLFEAPEETGTTFLENAVEKANFYFDKTGVPTLADDSGIHVEALANELGIHTRRWGVGAAATDAEWIAHFLERMKCEPNKRASFICSLAYIDKAGALHTFEGRCDGDITETLEADYLPGLPISACFRPDGFSSVFSGLSLEQKNSTSHRGRAVHAFKDFLKSA